MKMSVTTKSALAKSAELLTWDTEFWGTRVGRGFSAELDRWAIENTIGCMCLLIAADDHHAIHKAEAQGARLMDTRMEFVRETGPEAAISRPATDADVEALAAIAHTAFRGMTRFYADPRFADSRCDELYETWLRSSCEGWAAKVLMIGDGLGPAGFVTVHDDGDDAASIGLIALDERIRGRGMGTNLSRAAVTWAYDEGFKTISVVTQGCNVPAQRAFQRAGFITGNVAVWLHKWYAD
jgi:dTDP-4-amino-4,6-dideoxy-D-galactose acyltransferase